MKQLKILICGGGIAGFTLAYWLRQHGHCLDLIHKRPNRPVTGTNFPCEAGRPSHDNGTRPDVQ